MAAGGVVAPEQAAKPTATTLVKRRKDLNCQTCLPAGCCCYWKCCSPLCVGAVVASLLVTQVAILFIGSAVEKAAVQAAPSTDALYGGEEARWSCHLVVMSASVLCGVVVGGSARVPSSTKHR